MWSREEGRWFGFRWGSDDAKRCTQSKATEAIRWGEMWSSGHGGPGGEVSKASKFPRGAAGWCLSPGAGQGCRRTGQDGKFGPGPVEAAVPLGWPCSEEGAGGAHLGDRKVGTAIPAEGESSEEEGREAACGCRALGGGRTWQEGRQGCGEKQGRAVSRTERRRAVGEASSARRAGALRGRGGAEKWAQRLASRKKPAT